VTEGAVGSLVIVEVEPWCERSGSVFAGSVDDGVGPFALQGLDEPFGFAVRARPVRPREDVLDPEANDCAGVELGSVARSVVGHDPLHSHRSSCEPGDRPFQERDARPSCLVGEDLDVGDAAGVIDRDVTALPPRAQLFARADTASSGHPMARTTEPTQPFDVDMDELAGMTPAIPVRGLQRLQPRQPMQPDP